LFSYNLIAWSHYNRSLGSIKSTYHTLSHRISMHTGYYGWQICLWIIFLNCWTISISTVSAARLKEFYYTYSTSVYN
jgi:hypothetical protein